MKHRKTHFVKFEYIESCAMSEPTVQSVKLYVLTHLCIISLFDIKNFNQCMILFLLWVMFPG